MEELKLQLDENKPRCPYCGENVESADKRYTYSKLMPDTRWFRCNACEIHYGYHRIKASWSVDPHDVEKLQDLILKNK